MSRTPLAAFASVVAFAIMLPTPATGQTAQPLLIPGLSGSAELGARTFLDGGLTPQQMGKFEEFKNPREGAVLQSLLLRYTPLDSFRLFQVTGRNIGQRDQSVGFRAAQPGLFDFNVKWDGIPHVYSTTARMLGTRPSPDVFSLAGAPRGDTNTVNRALDVLTSRGTYLSPVRSGWNPFRAALAFTPSPALDSRIEYRRIDKRGDRPMGMSFGSSPSMNSREILEPIKQVQHDFRLSQGYATDRYQLNASYELSMFRNAFQSVTSDNPLNAVDSPTAGSARGQNGLAPNNVAHMVSAGGALNLPFHSRVTGNVAYSIWRQDQAFVPATINSAVSSSPNVAAALATMPASLDARAGTSTMAFSANTRPISSLTVEARFRRYEFRDQTAVTQLPLLIVNDRMPSKIAAVEVERDPFKRQTSEVTATWRAWGPLALTSGYGRESMDLSNPERNTDHYAENTARFGAGLTGNRWASLRTSYSKGWRRSDGYHQTDSTILASFRRMDLANRDRERLTVIGELFPIDQLTFSGTWKIGRDEYPGSQYGLQSDHSTMIGGDVEWTPADRFSLGGGYSRELFRNRMRARYRTGTLDVPANDWVGTNTDHVSIASAFANAVLVPGKLEVGASIEASHSRYLMAAMNPGTITAPTESGLAAAKAVNWPEITQDIQPVSTFVRWTMTPEWATTLRYQGELYSQNDFRTMGKTYTLIHMYLGNYYQNFNARYLTISLTYRPGVIRGARSTM